jgi:hypothetical protein
MTCNPSLWLIRAEREADEKGRDFSWEALLNDFSGHGCVDCEDMGSALLRHRRHRRALYTGFTRCLSAFSDQHDVYLFMSWCHKNDVFIHPALTLVRRSSQFRDYTLVLHEPVDRLCPLVAVPEHLLIGFKNLGEGSSSSNNLPTSTLEETEQKEKEFNEANGTSNSDICQFFFSSLGMMISDLVTALSGGLTDARHGFAQHLRKVRSVLNAPYFDNDVVFDSTETCLADVLLQMVRNYIHGGPLVGKLTRDELQWALSVCMSHSTPLGVGAEKSIGVIPLIHMLPHGGTNMNSVLIARNTRRQSATRMANYFRDRFGLDFGDSRFRPLVHGEPRFVYAVATRSLAAGEEVLLQAMAPVCEQETQARQMWKLSCGEIPEDYVASAVVAKMQHDITREIITRGTVD